jgi:hypothetical protein
MLRCTYDGRFPLARFLAAQITKVHHNIRRSLESGWRSYRNPPIKKHLANCTQHIGKMEISIRRPNVFFLPDFGIAKKEVPQLFHGPAFLIIV